MRTRIAWYSHVERYDSLYMCFSCYVRRDRPPAIEDSSADDSDAAGDNKAAEAEAARRQQEEQERLKREKEEQARWALATHSVEYYC